MTMQHDEITEKKRALRRTIAERRKQYPQEVLADLSAQITERILALEAYQKARTVFLYMELPGEVQMRALIEQCLRDGKKAAVPKVFRGSGRMHSPDGEASTPGMRLYEIRDFDHLVRGAMNILEPDPAVCACLDEEEDALMIMPYYTTAAIPGLFIGCIIANAVGGGILIDVIAGSLVTLGGAIGARLLRKKPWLMPLPTVVLNILVVPLILKYGYGVPLPLYLSMIYIAVGAVIACYGLGMPLYYALRPGEPFLSDDFELPWESQKTR